MKAGIVASDDWPIFKEFIQPGACEELTPETASVFGLTEDDLAVGALVILYYDDGPEIASLYVAPEYRRRGGAKLLLTVAEAMADESGIDICITLTASDPAQAMIRHIVKQRGYCLLDTGILQYHFPLDAFEENGKVSKQGSFFRDLDEAKKKQMSNHALTHQLPVPEEGFFGERVDQDVSAAIPGMDGAYAYVLVETEGRNRISVSGLYNGTNDSKKLMGLIYAALESAREKYPEDTMVSVVTINETADKLLRFFLPDVENDLFVYQYPGM